MRELYIDLIKKKKSKPKIYLGILSVIFALVSAFIQYDYNSLSIFNIIYSLYFLLFGIGYLFEGSGKSTGTLFGGKYIDLTEESLTFKISLFGEKHSFPLQNIKSIITGIITIEILTLDGGSYKIDLSTLDYLAVVELKQFMSDISAKL